MNSPEQRKQVRHFDDRGHCHELTFSCYQRRPLLDDDRRRVLFSAAIDAAVPRLGFTLVAFVYMPEHVHLLVWAKEPTARVSELLFAIKRPVSYRIKEFLRASADPLLEELTVRERPGKMTFRFWQEGGGYDRNLVVPVSINASAEYLHNNPVRRGLVVSPVDWKWSSWRHYHLPGYTPDPDLPMVDGFHEM
jgi:putative transposase